MQHRLSKGLKCNDKVITFFMMVICEADDQVLKVLMLDTWLCGLCSWSPPALKIVHSNNVKLCIDIGFVYLPKILLSGDKVSS